MTLILSGTDGLSDIDGSAATPAIRGTDANTGIYFGTDIVSVSTGGVQRSEFDASGNFKFNSGYGSVATAYGCRAWVNFNGTSTVAIRASGNVTSITDNGVGDYTVNFTTAMVDANYAALLSSDIGAGNGGFNGIATSVAPTTSAVRFIAYTQAGGFRDIAYAFVAVFR